MTREKEDMESKLQEQEKDLENNQNRITNQREVIDSLHKTCETKEQQEQTIKEQYDKEAENLLQTKQQLRDAVELRKAVKNQNASLKHTLNDSHKEMVDLVEKYERTVEELLDKEEKIIRITDALADAVREATNVKKLHEETRVKNDKLDSELNDVYTSLRRKEEVLRTMETKLRSQLREREDHCMSLQTQMNRLESTYAQEN